MLGGWKGEAGRTRNRSVLFLEKAEGCRTEQPQHGHICSLSTHMEPEACSAKMLLRGHRESYWQRSLHLPIFDTTSASFIAQGNCRATLNSYLDTSQPPALRTLVLCCHSQLHSGLLTLPPSPVPLPLLILPLFSNLFTQLCSLYSDENTQREKRPTARGGSQSKILCSTMFTHTYTSEHLPHTGTVQSPGIWLRKRQGIPALMGLCTWSLHSSRGDSQENNKHQRNYAVC